METKKTKFKLTGLFALLLILLSFSPAITKAQCPSIQNNLTCPVQLQADVYVDKAGSCSYKCWSTSIWIPAGATVPISCRRCEGWICNVVVTVTDIGGMTAYGTADYSTALPGNIISSNSPCLAPSYMARIYYTPGQFMIIP